jgi:protein SCO1/2
MPSASRRGTDPNSIRSLRIFLWAAAVATALAAAWFLVLAPRFAGGPHATLGRGDYRLAATDGSTFTEASLKGQPSAVFFGFTHCPDVCPTTLGDIGAWEEELGADAGKLRFWFVTIDPERDTIDLLRDYVSWTPGVTGAAGAPEEVQKAIEAFKVYARRVPLADGSYTMDHSAFIMLFDRDGRFNQLIAYQEPTESAVAKLRQLIAQG